MTSGATTLSVPSILQSLPAIDAPGGRRAAAVGMFDGVHLGHRFLLGALREVAAERGLRPAVFTFPQHPLEVVNQTIAPKLLSSPAEKLRLLVADGIAPADVCFLAFDSALQRLTAGEFIAMLHDRYGVDFILRGFNNRFGTERLLTAADYRDIAAAHGVELVDAPHFGECSPEGKADVCSSSIRAALAEGDVEKANRLLGYSYRLCGIVENGRHLGRTIGFPTANIHPLHPAKLIPADGVYVCRVFTPDGPFRAMLNIGRRPTVEQANAAAPRSIEAHLLDFDGDLYGRTVAVEFHHRLRGEMRFPSLDHLAAQLRADRLAVLNFSMPE